MYSYISPVGLLSRLCGSFKVKLSPELLAEECKWGRVAEVKRLIELGVDVNAVSPQGFTALHYAASFGNLRTAQILIENGADLNAPTISGETPIHLASANRHVDCLKLLLSRGADANSKESVCGVTALHLSCCLNMVECATALINFGANIELADRQGRTPLHWAACGCFTGGSPNCIHLLLSHGVKTDVITEDDRKTPLDLAKDLGNTACVDLLEKHGARIKRPDSASALTSSIQVTAAIHLTSLHQKSDCSTLVRGGSSPSPLEVIFEEEIEGSLELMEGTS